MSIFDKAMAKVMPLESDEDRAEARQKAQDCAKPGDWLSMILDHHRQLEMAFADTLAGSTAEARRTSCKKLATMLLGHAQAEESVLYPQVADTGHKTHAGMGYDEQAMVKTEMALLERLDPMSEDWTDKLKHVRDAVAHHMYQEESNWFPELMREAPDQAMLTQRYREEYERYMSGAGGMMSQAQPAQPIPA